MKIGDALKVKDLKVGTFYIFIENKAMYLSVYLGVALQGSYKVYYFYNTVALMGDYPEIFETQTLDLQNQINYVFSKKLERGCLKLFPNSLLGKVYDLPNAFYADVEDWYMKNRLLDNDLPKLNLNIEEVKEASVVKNPERNTVYARAKKTYYLYLGYDTYNKVYKMLKYSLNCYHRLNLIGYVKMKNLPKLYTVDQMYFDKQITEEEKRRIENRDYQKDIRKYDLKENLFVDQ